MASQTFFLWLFAWDLTITDNLFLIALYGGIISGIGCGLVFKGLGNTGGTDFVAIIIKHFKPYAKIGNLLMGIETIIVLCGIYFLNIEQALYALIAVYICSKLIDLVIAGNRFGKVCYIISNRYEAIAHVIMKELGRGVTAYEAMGMYKNENRKVLMVIIDRKQIPRVKEIVYSNDKDAFIFLCDASEVAGNGFCNLEDTMEI